MLDTPLQVLINMWGHFYNIYGNMSTIKSCFYNTYCNINTMYYPSGNLSILINDYQCTYRSIKCLKILCIICLFTQVSLILGIYTML